VDETGLPPQNLRKILEKNLAVVSFTSILFGHTPSLGVFLVKSEGKVMVSSVTAELDFIEELRLRRWAREHYVPQTDRQPSWHPIVHDEMYRKDEEAEAEEMTPQYA
jgi:hypothetical protein